MVRLAIDTLIGPYAPVAGDQGRDSRAERLCAIFQIAQPAGQGLPDRVRRVLLGRMVPAHNHLALRGPAAACLLLARPGRARVSLEIELGDVAVRKPCPEGRDD